MTVAPTELRLAMQANGYQPLPAQGKKVLLQEWSTKTDVPQSEVMSWGVDYPQWSNTGILTEYTPAFDADIRQADAAEAVNEAARDWFGDRGKILTRYGEPPKFAFLLRTERPFAKISINFIAPNGDAHKIEMLGAGQQLVVAGIHPDTKKPYSWHGGYEPSAIPRDDLPEIDEKEAEEFLDYIADMLVEKFGFRRVQTRSNGHDADASEFATQKAAVDVERELASIHHGNIHDTWLYCMGSDLRKGMPANDVIRRLLQATRESPACQADPRRKLWGKALAEMMTWYLYSDPTFIPNLPPKQQLNWHKRLAEGRKPRLIWRDDHGLQVRREAGQADADKGEAGSETQGNEQENEQENGQDGDGKADDIETKSEGASDSHNEQKREQKQTKANPWPTPYSGRATAQIPLRNFILGQHYLVGASSVTASAGGIGKSTLSLNEAVSFAIGRNLLTGETLEKRRRVWIWNAEDDIDEMERRVAGICAHYGINRADLDSWLFLDSGYDLPLDLAHGNGKGAVIQEGLIDLIAARVKEREIEVVMLDPLVALHTMSEGDNPGHAKLIRTLSTRLAKPCNCAVDINAHTRKPGVGQDTMTVDDIRGAGAIVYSARSGRILHPMSLAEAEKYNIEADDRFSYYRLERAKANMAKRGTICWVHMIEVPIANRPDGSYGDTVAVPTIWTPPDAMEGITETISNAIAGEIAKGEYRRDARSGASWAGRLVGLRCGIDIGTKSGRDRAKTILEILIKKGVLAVDIRYDKNRNSREYVVPGALHARQ